MTKAEVEALIALKPAAGFIETFPKATRDWIERAAAALAALAQRIAELEGWHRAALVASGPNVTEINDPQVWQEQQVTAMTDLVERAEAALRQARAVMHGEGVEDQGEAWDKCLRILDDAAPAAPGEGT